MQGSVKKQALPDTLQALGRDVRSHVLKFLPSPDLRSFSQTARYIHAQADAEWVRRVQTEFGVTKHPNFDKERSWCKIYMEHEHDNKDMITYAENGVMWGIRCCLRHGADPNTSIKRGQGSYTVFYAACNNNHFDVAELLLANGANIDQELEEGNTALLLACFYGQRGLVEFLLKNGANPNHCNVHGYTAIGIACTFSDDAGVMRVLLEHGVDVDASSVHIDSLLGHMCESNFTNCIEFLLSKGAEPNLLNDDGDTLLHIMCNHTNFESVELLLKAGADVNAVGGDGWRPLHYAALWGHIDIIALLIRYGANLNATTVNGETPQDIAENCGQINLF